MLMTTEKSVAAIGEAAGFQNDSYYIKMFHLTYGETPGNTAGYTGRENF